MAFKLVVLCAAISMANAGFLAQPAQLSYAAPAITSQSANILRSPGNLAQISTYSKTIDTPFSSVSKSDVRVSNPGLYSTLSYAAPVAPIYAKAAYAAPALSYAAAPALSYAAAPAPLLTKAAHFSYAAPYAAPLAAAPLVKAAPAVAAPGPVVAHTAFSGYGVHYAF